MVATVLRSNALLYTNCYTLLDLDMNISEMIVIIIFNSKSTTFNMVNWKILNDQDEEMVTDFEWTDGSSLSESQLKFTPTYATFGVLTEPQDVTYYMSIQYGEDPGIATRSIPFTVKV